MRFAILPLSLSFFSLVALAGPIHNATKAGDLQAVQVFIKYGANVDAKANDSYQTPLHIAIWNNYLELAYFFIENGANVNSEDYLLQTPLHYASRIGNKKLVKTLLDHNADINKEAYGARIPLHYASLSGDLETVELLVERGANVNAEISHSFLFGSDITPYELAATAGHLTVAQYLSEQVAKSKIENQ